MYFFDDTNISSKSIAPGVDIKVATGERCQLSYVTLSPGSSVPMHNHPHEQMGVILEGEFEFVIGDEKRHMKKGDMYVIPGGVTHGIPEVKVAAVALDVFAPPREEYQ